MKILATRWLPVAAGLVVLGGACSSTSNTKGAGTGGKVGSGGASTGSGGSSSGSGGTNTGSGGTSTGSGGASTGNGGTSAGSGGGGVATDAGAGASFGYTFDATMQGFGLNNYVPGPPQKNLAAPDSGASPTLVFDPLEGSPTPGSLKLTASFTDFSQLVDVAVGIQPAVNLAGKTIHALVRLNSGTFPVGMGATLHAGTGMSYAYGAGAYTSLVAGTWTDLTLDLTKQTAPFDPTIVVQIGIQFYSGDRQDAGAFPGPVDVVIQIDGITDGAGATVGPAAVAYNFDIAAQGFQYNNYLPTNQTNLAAPGAASPPTLMWDAVEGSPTKGSLKASATFTDYKQLIDVILNPSPALNLMGKTLHAKVRLTSGTFGSGSGALLHASTGMSYLYGAGAYTTLTYSTWTDLTLDLSTVTTALYDPTMVVQIGIQFYSGDPTDAGAFAGPNQVVFHIDSITE